MSALAALLAESPPPPPPVTAPRLKLALETREDRAGVDALIADAFGPGRYAKTAERLREGNVLATGSSWCAWSGGELVGAVRTWPVRIGPSPALFLGPIAVARSCRRRGLGALLVERACEASYAAEGALVLLVGDRAFFEPLGFEPVPAGRIAMPGPVDGRRVLWHALRPGALDVVAGPVRVPERAV